MTGHRNIKGLEAKTYSEGFASAKKMLAKIERKNKAKAAKMKQDHSLASTKQKLI